jgi:hypothetical protein
MSRISTAILTSPTKAQVFRSVLYFADNPELNFALPYCYYEIQFNQRIFRCDLDISWEAERWGISSEQLLDIQKKIAHLTLDDYCNELSNITRILNVPLLKSMDKLKRRECLLNFLKNEIVRRAGTQCSLETHLEKLPKPVLYGIISLLIRSGLMLKNQYNIQYRKKKRSPYWRRTSLVFFGIGYLTLLFCIYSPTSLLLASCALSFLLAMCCLLWYNIDDIDVDINVNSCSTVGDMITLICHMLVSSP